MTMTMTAMGGSAISRHSVRRPLVAPNGSKSIMAKKKVVRVRLFSRAYTASFIYSTKITLSIIEDKGAL